MRHRYCDWTAGTGSASLYTYPVYNSTSASTSTNYSSFRIYDTTDATYVDKYNVQLVSEHEELGPIQIAFDQWTYRQFKVATVSGSRPRLPHEVHEFRYDHGKYIEGMGPTQRLAPLFEEVELAPRKAFKHLRKLLRDPKYRKWQLKMINAVNKRLGTPEAVYDEEKVKAKLVQLIKERRHSYYYKRTANKRKKKMLKAQKIADELLRKFLPEELQVELETKQRIELIAKNGSIFEILRDGRVNKLLPEGKKQGLCIHPKYGPYPVSDVILAKKLLIETNPNRFEEIAHKTSPFQLSIIR